MVAAVLFLGYAVFSLAWNPTRVTAGSPPVATCTAGNEAPTQMSTMSSLGSVEVRCPSDAVLDPAAPAAGADAEVYAKSGDTAKVKLNTLVPGALFAAGSGGANLLTVAQLPSQDVNIFFRCVKGAAPQCWIGITVSAQPALGPQGCAVGGSSITLTITAANQTAQFMCAQNKVVLPTTAANVYSSDCKTEIVLTNEIPGATLKREAGATMSSFTVTALPTDNKSVCVVCGANASDADNEKCSVKIDVISTSSGGVTGMTARAASALGIVLAGAALYLKL